MPNLRIISDNAADRAALSASSVAGLLAAANLQTDKKSSVWRASSNTARVSATWSAAEPIQAVAMPFCNWSPTATWRIRLSSEAQATNLLTYSEGTVAQLGSSAFATNDAAFAGFSASIRLSNATGSAFAYKTAAVTAAVVYALSFFVKMDDSSAPVIATSSGNIGGDFMPVFLGAAYPASSTIVSSLGGGVYRVSVTVAASSTTTSNFGLVKYSGNSTRGFVVQGFQLETIGVTSYYPTSGAAGTRPLGYIDAWQSYGYDSGVVSACPAPAATLRGWTAAQSASAYAYGGGACARLWMPASVAAYGMAIDISDSGNLQGYVEAGRLVCGPYWEPVYTTKSLSETYVDAATHFRTDAGDLLTAASTIHKKIPIEFEYLSASDRARLADILRASRAYPIFLSVFPGNSDLALERAHTVYGKRMTDSEVAVQAAILYGAPLEVESV